MRFSVSAGIALLLAAGGVAFGIDVDPSKRTVPQKFINPPGRSMNLFAGDPKRVDKANTVFRKDFEVGFWFDPSPVAVPADASAGLPQVRAGLVVKNISKRPKTLAFPTSQRVELAVQSAAGAEVYRWGADKQFVEASGTSMVMPQEKVIFSVDVPFGEWKVRPRPGDTFVFSGVLAGYPEFTATTNVALVVQEGPAPMVASGAAPGAQTASGPGLSPMPGGLSMPGATFDLSTPALPAAGGAAPGMSLGPGGGDGGGMGGLSLEPLPQR